MIGQNDTVADRVTVADARRLIDLSRKLGLGRVSLWSLNRDTRCGAQLDPGLVSPNCSGVDQKPLAFTYVLDQIAVRAVAGVVPHRARRDARAGGRGAGGTAGAGRRRT